MRRLRVLLVVAMLGGGFIAPVVAQAEAETEGWGWGALVESLRGWTEGVWSAVAGSKTESPPLDGGGGTGVVLDGGEQYTTTDFPSTDAEAFPGFDPDG